MKDFEVEQDAQETTIRVTCGCDEVFSASDLSQERMQMAMRCLDVHFKGQLKLYNFLVLNPLPPPPALPILLIETFTSTKFRIADHADH